MKAAIIISVILASLSMCVYAQAARPDASRAADESEIRSLISEINKAYVARDYEPFERIFLDNYVAIRNKPEYNYRAQLIAMMKYDARELAAGKALDYQTISYDSDVPQIRFFGNTAIVTVAKRNSWKYKVDKCLTKYQATEVWLKRDGSWHVAATQNTTFPCETPFFYPPHPAVAALPMQTGPPGNSDPAAERAVRTFLEQLTTKLSAPQSGGYDQLFAEDFVLTNTEGQVSGDREPFLAAYQLRPVGVARLNRRDEALVIFDDTAIFMFRYKLKGKTGEPEAPIQASVVLVNMAGRWQIVAAHLNKVTAD